MHRRLWLFLSTRDAAFVYLVMSSISSLAYSLLLTVELVYLTKTVGFNPLQLVLIGTVRQSMSFLLQVPTGILADMYSRRWSVILGILLIGIGYLIEGAIPVFGVILAFQVCYGLGTTLVDGADTAWLADEIGVERAAPIYLRASQLGSLASLLGIGVSTILINVGLNLPLVLGGCVFIALSLLLLFIMPERHFTPTPREDRTTWQQMRHTLNKGLQLIRRHPLLIAMLSTSIFAGIFSAGFDQLWQYHLLRNFTLPSLGRLMPETWFCIIEACIVATNFCGTTLARRYVDTGSHRAVTIALFIIEVLSSGSVLGFALAGQFALALCAFFLFTTVRAPGYPLQQVWLNQQLESRVRATIFSVKGQLGAIAQILGGPIIGLIATTVNMGVALLVSGLILCPSLLLYMYVLRRNKLGSETLDSQVR